jgi:ABC-type antimicrobial peptide transport system permease subunit
VITVFVILLISAVGVVNTMLMAVLERTREIGVLKALGMRGVRVVKMIVLEALLLALASAVVGMALGYLLDLYLVHYGIDLRSMTEGFSIGGMGLDPVLRGEINLRGFVVPVIVLAFSCLIASLYPAIRAARLRPAVGMRDL